MRDVMDALAELQAANEAIETAGPLYQTREPLKDKIVCLIGQRSDLITQVLALRRELDAAHARIRKFEARAEQAERERDEARRQVAALIEGLQLVSDALARLDQIYRADTDLGDPPVETPAWLREAQHRAAALLAPPPRRRRRRRWRKWMYAMRERRNPRRRVIYTKKTIVFHRPGETPPDPIPPVTALECGHEVPGYTVGRYRACPECGGEEKR